jgi:hypothetical protein
MSANVVIQGVVRADGTLELEGKVPLPAGRVRVTLEPVPHSQETDPFFAMLRKIRAIRESHGVLPDAAAAIAAARNVRDEFDEQVEAAGQLQEECRRRRQEAGATERAEG